MPSLYAASTCKRRDFDGCGRLKWPIRGGLLVDKTVENG